MVIYFKETLTERLALGEDWEEELKKTPMESERKYPNVGGRKKTDVRNTVIYFKETLAEILALGEAWEVELKKPLLKERDTTLMWVKSPGAVGERR